MVETSFKETKVGVVPSDWNVVPLKQITSVFGRIGFRGYNVTDLVPESQGAITLSPSNIQNGVMVYDRLTYLSWEKYEESPEIMIYNGDILFVKTGSTYGKTAYVENLPWPSTINPQFVVFKKTKCNSRLLSYLLAQHNFQDQVESITSGGAIPTMSQRKLLECFVALPPKDESNKDVEADNIAQALSDIDSLITTLQNLIEKKRNIKQGAMQELLSGKRRLKGYNDKWIEISLGELCKPYKGIQINKNDLKEDAVGYPVMNGGISPSGYHNEYNAESNTIIISEGGNSCGFVNFITTRFWASGHCYVLDPREINDKNYIYQVLKFNEPQIMALRTGSGLPNIKKTALWDFKFRMTPNPKEQCAITAVLSDMDSEISALERRLEKYQDLKQGMMQQLLTGKIRLV